MKIVKLISIFLILMVVSCYSDKGNYEYAEIEEITFENVDESYNIIGGAEKLVVTPIIKSKKYGIISPTDKNYDYSYLINVWDAKNDLPWSTLHEGEQALDILISARTGAYQMLINVLDRRTGITYSKMSKLVIASTTYEGWMLFGTEGAEKRSRLDMISYISATRQIPVYDLMASRGLPAETTGAYGIGFWANALAGTVDRLYLLTDQNAYMLDREELTTSNKQTINIVDFLSPKIVTVPVIYRSQEAKIIVTKDGDAYSQYSPYVGPRFAYPINTSVRGTDPEYKVAPFLGYNATRPISNFNRLFVLYDITNSRFMGWDYAVEEGTTLFPLLNPSTDVKFDYNIGMDMLFMEGTSFDGGVAFAVMKDKAGEINVAGIKVNAKNFEQHSYYPAIKAPRIKEATKFAFHSQFPLLFYVVGSDIYCYNLETKASNLALSKPDEEITCIKFNLFNNKLQSNGILNKMDEEFLSLQYKLVVCSYNNSDDKNGGTFGLYKVDASANSLTRNVEYSGCCKIVDVLYRERRK